MGSPVDITAVIKCRLFLPVEVHVFVLRVCGVTSTFHLFERANFVYISVADMLEFDHDK
jgi:hypothetical protein